MTVADARMADPKIAPDVAFRPDGISIETTGMLAALTRLMISPSLTGTGFDSPAPNKASTITV